MLKFIYGSIDILFVNIFKNIEYMNCTGYNWFNAENEHTNALYAIYSIT